MNPEPADSNQAIEAALASPDPIQSLRSMAVELSRSGMGRGRIYSLCLESFTRLESAGRVDDSAKLGDVMDMISNSFAPDNPNNMDLPE